jgi:hypothetical protein
MSGFSWTTKRRGRRNPSLSAKQGGFIGKTWLPKVVAKIAKAWTDRLSRGD